MSGFSFRLSIWKEQIAKCILFQENYYANILLCHKCNILCGDKIFAIHEQNAYNSIQVRRLLPETCMSTAKAGWYNHV